MRSRIIPTILILALATLQTPLRAADPTPPTPADILQIENFLDGCPLENLIKKNDPNTSLRNNLFTKWVHAHRTGKSLQVTANYLSAGSTDKSSFTANLSGQSPLFDFLVTASLPDADTDKALTITKNQRVTVVGTIDTVSYSIGNYGPELHVKLTHASLTDLSPPPPALGPISIRSLAAKVRLTDSGVIDNDKQKDEIAQMTSSAAKADADEAAYLQKNSPTLDAVSTTLLAHAVPYIGMPNDLLFLTGKTLQTRDSSKSNGIETKTILFSTFGYADDAFLLTLKGDSVSAVKKVPIPDAKYYATAEDAPPPPPKPKPKPKVSVAPKK